jgi:cell wall-associated NlpC family hydrolase
MSARRRFARLGVAAAGLLLCACATQTPDATFEAATEAPLRSDSSIPRVAGSGAGGELVIAAMTFLDRPYQAGGDRVETGFDCSGFTRHVYGQALGIELPRSAQEQALAPNLRPVSSRNALQPGDLVFFNTQHRTYSHVGIYLGDGRFIHAPRTGAQIRTESMAATYWSRRYTGGRRAATIGSDP